jgi:small subunit ribosomal protein S16
MLAIRMQRTGRSGHAMFRVIVQDSHRSPTSGKVVAYLGNYDPHAKTVSLDKEKVSFYLEHGAQPSDRLARLLKSEGVALPAWVSLNADKERQIRNAAKRRSTRPAGEEAPEPVVEAEDKAAEAVPVENKEVAEQPAVEAQETAEATVKSETPAETAAEEKVEEIAAAETALEEAAAEPAAEPEAEKTDSDEPAGETE